MAWYRSLPEYEQADEYSFYISDFKGGINMSEDDQNMSLSESPLAYNVSGKDGSLKRCEGYGRAYKQDRKSTRLNSSHKTESRMPSSA